MGGDPVHLAKNGRRIARRKGISIFPSRGLEIFGKLTEESKDVLLACRPTYPRQVGIAFVVPHHFIGHQFAHRFHVARSHCAHKGHDAIKACLCCFVHCLCSCVMSKDDRERCAQQRFQKGSTVHIILRSCARNRAGCGLLSEFTGFVMRGVRTGHRRDDIPMFDD
jgi:hypothetical protein